jgi:hypothetical protein
MLAPLADLAPDLVVPGTDRMIATLAAERAAIEAADAVVAIARWDGDGWVALGEAPVA